MKTNVLVLGAGYAGIMAVNRLAKKNTGIKVTLVNDSETFVERIRNHERVTGKIGQDKKIQDLISDSIEFKKARVLGISPQAKEVEISNSNKEIEISNSNKEIEKISYDYLIYTFGSTQTNEKQPGEYGVNTREDAEKLRNRMQSKDSGKAWVLGGGLTGIELATELKESYPNWKIGILEKGKFAEGFSKKGQGYIRSTFAEMGIEILENKTFQKFEENKITLTDEIELQSDLYIKTFGFTCSNLGKKAGLKVNDKNQIYVNEYLQIKEFPEIFCAGDSSYLPDSYLRMGCVTAMPMGVYVADTIDKLIEKKTLKPFRFRFTGRCVSLGRKKGLIQFVKENDAPIEKILKGRAGAIIKESICKYTMLSMKFEKNLPFPAYTWPKSKLGFTATQNMELSEIGA